MYGAKGTQAYAKIEVESAVMSASQQQLVIMLFDGALSAAGTRASVLADGNIPAKGLALSKAINIIENGLKVGTVENNGDELTQNLIALYAYMVRRLLHANVNNDASAIEEVENLLRNIADGWKEVAGTPQLMQDAV